MLDLIAPEPGSFTIMDRGFLDFARLYRLTQAGAFFIIRPKSNTLFAVCTLKDIEQYAVGNMIYTRFNYLTGDAAGQNMVGKATFAVSEWIKSIYPDIKNYMLSGNIDTDKKHSYMNFLPPKG